MDTSISDAADYLSANCFLNAYVREFDDWRLGTAPAAWQKAGFPTDVLIVPLGHQTLWIGVLYWSDCGRHRFSMPAKLEGRTVESVGFLAAAKLLVENAAIQANGTIGAMARFLQRIIESHRNLEMLLALREREVPALFEAPLSFREGEQGLLIGHSVHPAPKVRQPMTLTEALQYGPEGGAGFALAWAWVRKERIHYHSADAVTLAERVQALVDADAAVPAEVQALPEGYELVPVHPWQCEQWRKNPQLQQAFAQEDIILLAPAGLPWHATSSMRSIYAEHAPYMLKFSLSVRLTNSVRHLQPAEAERGCLISKVLATPVGEQFTKRFTQFDIMEEPAYFCVLGDDGAKLPDTMTVFRANIVPNTKEREHTVLATLTQDHPWGGRSRLAQQVMRVASADGISESQAAAKWFDAFLAVAIRPLLLAQADYGLLFGAHQQNIVLGLEDGLPVHGYFRDCQGTGFSEVGAKLFKLDLNALGESAENQINSDMANKLFAYYLIINTSFGVISAMGADGLLEERALIDQLQRFLASHLTAQRRDTSFIDTMLESPELWQKGNFICSLADLNENTLQDPVSIYRAVNNPVRVTALASIQNA